eukprot:2255208-Rhodomonas_salina.1
MRARGCWRLFVTAHSTRDAVAAHVGSCALSLGELGRAGHFGEASPGLVQCPTLLDPGPAHHRHELHYCVLREVLVVAVLELHPSKVRVPAPNTPQPSPHSNPPRAATGLGRPPGTSPSEMISSMRVEHAHTANKAKRGQPPERETDSAFMELVCPTTSDCAPARLRQMLASSSSEADTAPLTLSQH